MKYKEAYDLVLPESKRNEEKYNLMVSYFIRPISIYMTLPLIHTKVKPTTITKLSILLLLLGFYFFAFGKSILFSLIGWGLIFTWVLLDGVDGNLARCTDQCSLLGDLWDTMGGYLAMIVIYFGSGIAAFYTNNLRIDDYWFLIIGGFTAVFSIFPRLMLHKKKSAIGNTGSVKEISDKKSFGWKNIIAMNFISPTGFMQIFLPIAICTHYLGVFIIFYFFVTGSVMILSLYKLLKE